MPTPFITNRVPLASGSFRRGCRRGIIPHRDGGTCQGRRAAKRPGVERVDACAVQARGECHCDVVEWINGTGLP